MDCGRIESEEIAERYLLGRLTDEDRDAFESHFFACDRCFDRLRTLRSVRAELRSDPAIEPVAVAAIRRRVPPWALAAAAVLAIGIGAGLWTLRRTNEVAPAQTATNPRTPEPRSLAELARVEPPPYIPVTLRSAEDWRVRFERAMADYSAARYADAVRGLEVVAAQQPSAANAWFFLGISSLMLDRTDEAIRALQRCLDSGDTAYAEDAQFFLAKAFLRKGDREAASRALAAVAASNGPRAGEARDLQAALLRLTH